MSTIAGTTLIDRAPTVVFTLLADPRNEPAYNRVVVAAEKVTPGPIRSGSRFTQYLRSVGSRTSVVQIELLEHDPPRHLVWHVTSAEMDVHGDVRLVSQGTATAVSWTWQFASCGWLRVLGPLPALLGARLERRVWKALKYYLEHESDDSTSPPPAAGAEAGPDLHRGSEVTARSTTDRRAPP